MLRLSQSLETASSLRIVTKTPHEFIRVTYDYIRVTYEYIRVTYESHTRTYEQHRGNIRIHTGEKVRLEAGTPGIQGIGTPTQEREKERMN